MDKRIKKMWLKALRTPPEEGGYVRTTGRLWRSQHHHGQQAVDCFCALGVLANLCNLEGGLPPDGADAFGSKYVNVGSDPLHDWAGLRMWDAAVVARLNDGGASFTKVADWIEANL